MTLWALFTNHIFLPRYSCHKVCGWIDAFVQNNSYCKWYMRKRKMPTYNEITSRSSVVLYSNKLGSNKLELCGQWLCPPCWVILPYPCLFFTITKAFPTGKLIDETSANHVFFSNGISNWIFVALEMNTSLFITVFCDSPSSCWNRRGETGGIPVYRPPVGPWQNPCRSFKV